MTKNSKVIPIACSLQVVGIPIVMAKPVEMKSSLSLSMLVDTGADISILDISVFDYLESNRSILENKNIVTATGTNIGLKTLELGFIINNLDYHHKFVGMDCSTGFNKIIEETGIKLHGILGCDFLQYNKWIIDFEKEVIISN